jgi:hypothetical protein
MMRWTEILNERGEAHLYHITNAEDAARIIFSNEMKPLTSHHSERLGLAGSKLDGGKGYITGVSLTRDIGFAKTWRSGEGAIFVLDAVRLRQNVRLRPIDYYAVGSRDKAATAKRSGHGSVRSEAEEFAIGGIKNLDRYVVEIRIQRREYEECIADNEDYEDQPGDSRYWYLTSSPKLKIV